MRKSPGGREDDKQVDDIVSDLLAVRTVASSQELLATMRQIDEAIKTAIAEIEEAAKDKQQYAHS